jgi:hypothetical protein
VGAGRRLSRPPPTGSPYVNGEPNNPPEFLRAGAGSDLQDIRAQLEGFKSISAISDEMRDVIETEYCRPKHTD